MNKNSILFGMERFSNIANVCLLSVSTDSYWFIMLVVSHLFILFI